MKFVNYIKYFFFVATNWNPRIAFHILKNEIRGEKQYGISSSGKDSLKELKKHTDEFDDSTIYMPASYDVLELCFQQLNLETCTHFLDIGCGKARAMIVAAYHGAKKISGVDISKTLLAEANKNIAMINKDFPDTIIKVHLGNAYYFPIEKDVDVVFLFNPFGPDVLEAVVNNIMQSLDEFPRKIKIVYLNSLYKNIFTTLGFRETFCYKKLIYLDASILEFP